MDTPFVQSKKFTPQKPTYEIKVAPYMYRLSQDEKLRTEKEKVVQTAKCQIH